MTMIAKSEREAVVRWLRDEARQCMVVAAMYGGDSRRAAAMDREAVSLMLAANAIERGDHMKGQTDGRG
jgi:hypothetical protein